MFKFKKIILFSIILFFVFIPKTSAKYEFTKDLTIEFQVENSSNIKIPDYFEIYTLEDLISFRNLQNSGKVDFEGKEVYLMNDIDMSSVEIWIPIATEERPFKGTFYGNSHIISNLQSTTIIHNTGLFGVNCGTITDLTVTGNITAHICENIGGIVGKNLRNN